MAYGIKKRPVDQDWYREWKVEGEGRRSKLIEYLGNEEVVEIPPSYSMNIDCFKGKHIREIHFMEMDAMRFWDDKPMPGLEDVTKIVCHYDSPNGSFMHLYAFSIRMPNVEEILVLSEKENQLILWKGIPPLTKPVRIIDLNCVRLTIYGTDDPGLHTDKLRLIMPSLNPAKADDMAGRAVVLHSFLQEPDFYAEVRETYTKSMKRNAPNWLCTFMALGFPDNVCDEIFRSIQPLKKEQYDKLLEAAEAAKSTAMAARIVEEREKHVDREKEAQKQERRENFDLEHPFSARNMRMDWDWEVLPDKKVRLSACKMEDVELIVVPPIVAGKTVTELGVGLFQERRNLKEVELPDTIEVIGGMCFAYTALETIVFPPALVRIEFDAFLQSNLKQFTLPQNMQTVSEFLLRGSPVEEVVLHDGVTVIEEEAFACCDCLKRITLPKNLRIIGQGAFNCAGLEEIQIPPSVQEIQQESFGQCTELKKAVLTNPACDLKSKIFLNSGLSEIVLPDGMEKIPEGMFSNCMNLKQITLPASIKVLQKEAFRGSGIRTIRFPEGLTDIEDGVFRACSRLVSIKLPDQLQTLGSSVFQRSTIEEVCLPDSLETLGFHIFSECLSLKKVRLPQTMQKIPNGMFMQCSIEKLSIPESVTEIGRNAFDRCGCLKQISLPEKLKKIGRRAFAESSLEQIVIPEGVTAIDEHAFKDCMHLKCVSLPNTLQSLGPYVFAQSSLEEVRLPGSLTVLGEGLFMRCKALKSMIWPEEIPFIPNSCFADSGLKWIRIPDSVSDIRDYAFQNCQKLSAAGPEADGNSQNGLTVSAGLERIGPYAFCRCNALDQVRFLPRDRNVQLRIMTGAFSRSGLLAFEVPMDVTVLSAGLFAHCPNLKACTLHDHVSRIQNDGFLGSGLSEIDLPDSVREIEESAFMDCKSLTRIGLQEGLLEIGKDCFRRSGLREITLPKSVMKIGRKAFNECFKLTRLKMTKALARTCMDLDTVLKDARLIPDPGEEDKTWAVYVRSVEKKP